MKHGHGWFVIALVVVGLVAASFALWGLPARAVQAQGSTIFVDADATGANDGTSWEDAYTAPQPALEEAAAGDEIWVAAGIYTPTYEFSPGDPRSATFQLKNGVALYGGFDPSVGDIGWEDRDWVGNVTVLNGDIGIAGDIGDNCYHVLYHPPELALDTTAILDGFTVTGGNADIANSQDSGGGMHNDGSSPTVTHCTFVGNSAVGFGGGMSNRNSSALVVNCTFSNNSSDYCGGGMSNGSSSSPTVTNCTFSGNSAYWGGGICNESSSSPAVTNSTFTGNSATGGGGMRNASSSPVVTNCTFTGNSATSGGGMRNYDSSPTVTNSILWGDSPQEIADQSSLPSITYSDIQGGYEGIGNIDADPLFVDPGSGDYHLGPDSPCMDAGTNDAPDLPATDFEGNPRVMDGNGDGTVVVDMGVDEILGDIIYVDQDAAGANDGTSWEDAFTALQPALEEAAGGDLICVAEGIYTPTLEFSPGDPRSTTFQLKNRVALYGGFDPTVGDAGWENRDWQNNVTILSGDLGIAGDPADNSYHVFYHPPELALDGSAILDGFVVTAGFAYDDSPFGPNSQGGGMYNDGSSPTLTNCTFSGNEASNQGGGMANINASSPMVSHCTFSDNFAFRGGGIFNESSSPTLTNCTFSGNEASNQGGGMANINASSPMVTHCTFSGNSAYWLGGGMYNNASSPEVAGCFFSGNWAIAGDGGGMSNNASSPMVTNSTFSGNSATAGSGGGMYNDSSSPTLTNCAFSDNSAGSGGGMYNDGSSPVVTDGIFEDNSASTEGGGMSNWYSSSPTVTTCTFSGNSAGVHGGGIFNDGSSPSVTDCTFSGNSANYSGGGMDNYSSSPAVTNCTFSGNSSDHGGSGMANWVSSSPSVTDCTFSGNSSEGMANWQYSSPTVTDCTFTSNLGSGMHNSEYSSPAVVNCTFTGNSGSGMSNGILSSPAVTNCTFSGNSFYGITNSSSSPTVTNCILWGDGLGEINNEESEPAVTYSDLQGGYEGTGNINEDPLFVAPGSGDYHLQRGSPCIDAGTNNAPNLPDYDFEGDPRVGDGSGDGAAVVDMGVDEIPPPVIFVDRDAAGANDGTSWEDALTDLQDALAWAVEDVKIWVAAGSYTPTWESSPGDPRSATFQLKNGVALYGGFDPTVGDTGWEGRDWVNNATILSGDIGIAGDIGDNSYHVFYHPAELGLGATAVLDGFKVSGGNGDAGGGMYNDGCSPTVTNCTFSGNSADSYGGGVSNLYGASPVVTNCAFLGNSANNGGGMFNDYHSLPVVTNCTFRDNSASFWGGGMGNLGEPVVTNCTFTDNSASHDGGGMYNGGGSSPTVTNCTFSGNSADAGGGMYNNYSLPAVTNCTFSGNLAEQGGGMFNWYSSPAVANCILWGDSPDEISSDESQPVVTYSDIQGGYEGTGNMDTDPLFVDPVSGDYHLGPDSPCMDAGTNDAPDLPDYDFEGDPRIMDGNRDGVAVVDMGVDEVYGYAVYLPTVFRAY